MAGSDHYEAEVNRGSLNMRSFTNDLNKRYQNGWRLAFVFSQEGNTIIVWEKTA